MPPKRIACGRDARQGVRAGATPNGAMRRSDSRFGSFSNVGVHAPGREQHAEVEEALRLGSAEEEIAAQQGVEQRGVIVREDRAARRRSGGSR